MMIKKGDVCERGWLNEGDLLVEPGHSQFRTNSHKTFYHFDSAVNQCGKFGQFILFKAIQQIINLPAFGEIITHAKTQAGIIEETLLKRQSKCFLFPRFFPILAELSN